MDLKSFFSAFHDADPKRLHFAAHSHHPWPDVSRDAQRQYWEDSTALADLKWGRIFGEVVPAVQAHIARILRLPDPATIAFAPNTHEFVGRLLSCLPQCPRILTTDSEFYSFDRQIRRLEEDGLAVIDRVLTEPFETFPHRFKAAMRPDHHMIFFSHVFFNSGYAVPDLADTIAAVPSGDTLAVIDGYHGFMALPTDLSGIAGRVFYLAGGYKYAMSGEGCCFLHCPPGYGARPRNTGWFADIGALEDRQAGIVPYAPDGYRFWGATFDPSSLYRMRAVLGLLEQNGLTVDAMHGAALELQSAFLNAPDRMPGALVTPVDAAHGRFLTFETGQAAVLCEALKQRNVITDCRGNRLRIGFGIYQDEGDVAALLHQLR